MMAVVVATLLIESGLPLHTGQWHQLGGKRTDLHRHEAMATHGAPLFPDGSAHVRCRCCPCGGNPAGRTRLGAADDDVRVLRIEKLPNVPGKSVTAIMVN